MDWKLQGKLLLLVGPAGCGKDTVASILQRAVPGLAVVKFAQPLKDFTLDLYDWSSAYAEAHKEEIDPRYGISPRQAQQGVGAVVRKLWSETFVNRALRRAHDALAMVKPEPLGETGSWIVRPGRGAIITDGRYINEAAGVAAAGGLIWRIQGRAKDLGTLARHESELEWNSDAMTAYVQREIDNSGTLEELELAVRAAQQADSWPA
jgi:energy-coupling factor transporter ATP-binding protein EcfA2